MKNSFEMVDKRLRGESGAGKDGDSPKDFAG